MARTAELGHTRTHALFLSPSLCLSRTVALSAHSGLNARQQGIRYFGSSASQNSLKPIPSTILIDLMSMHMNEINFCVQASCRAEDNELGRRKICIQTWLFRILCHIHLDAHFGDVDSSC